MDMAEPAASYGIFLRGLINNPRGVSAPAPSSPALARAIAAQVDLTRPGLVVELGPGTGVVTAALLDRGAAPDRILAIEQDRSLAQFMRGRFPAVDVRRGDALALQKHLHPGQQVAAVVSGLPLLNFPPAARASLIRRALALQEPGGCFIQLSYGWRPPVTPDCGVLLKGQAVWQNFPPAHIWTYRTA
jgi:phosphatidylethanolamine/phosphatidyl-N-methylethanolamine N-methyltransferase